MNDLNFLTSFAGGLLSFLSPCVLPLLPLYLSYLGITDGKIKDNIKMMLGFCLGINSVFILLSIGVKAVTPFLLKYQTVISLIGGMILIILGLHQLGFIEIHIFNKEKRISKEIKNLTFIKAFALGFIYSFSWTPCISTVITSIVTLSLSSMSSLSWLYIAVYGLGFTLPFVILGLVFKSLINAIKRYQKQFMILMKCFSVLIIAIGLYMMYDATNIIVNNQNVTEESEKTTEDSDILYADDIEGYDQHGNFVRASDFKGKYVLVTFSATWCGYCSQQEAFIEEFIKEHDDIVAIIIMSEEINQSNNGISIKEYSKDKTIPIIENDGSLFYKYGATSYPSNMLVGPDNSIVAGFAGAITNTEAMESVILQVKEIYESR